jgi:hypothetical protein
MKANRAVRMWNRFVERFNREPLRARQEMSARGWLFAQANKAVRTRQVLRAQARQDAMELVREIAGGEPRKNRRRMALSMARRDWRPAAA